MVVLGGYSRSILVGDGYGLILSAGLSWPLIRGLGDGVRLRPGIFWRSLALFLASLAASTAAVVFLGFNPQAARLEAIGWAEARALLWRFPLALPVENWMLVLFLTALGALSSDRGRSSGRALYAAGAAAVAFGLLHVPYWGGWAWFPVAASVLPWTIYMTWTGDLLAPLVAHLVLDMSVALALWPRLAPLHGLAPLAAASLLWAALGLVSWLGQEMLGPIGEILRHA